MGGVDAGSHRVLGRGWEGQGELLPSSEDFAVGLLDGSSGRTVFKKCFVKNVGARDPERREAGPLPASGPLSAPTPMGKATLGGWALGHPGHCPP